jgi:PKD repeat protein
LPAVSASAASPGVNDAGVIANAVPATFTPNIADGAVESLVQVGSRMVVGGTFTTVTPTAGPGAGASVARHFLFAFNAATGALDTGFVPLVNGEVDAIVPTADGTGVYVGGTFTTAGGISTRLAEFNLTTGARVAAFNPSLNGQINDMALAGGRLLVAGTFTSVKSVVHDGLVSINPTNGALDPYLTVNLTGHHNYGRVAGATSARVGATSIAVSPDGSRMIVDGNFTNAADPVKPAGYARDQIANIVLGPTSATVDPNWNTNAYTPTCFANAYDSYVRSIGWAPDGSYFVVAATGGYYGGSFQDCDTASRFNAASTGLTVTPSWINYTGTDSIYSVAVTSDAVYIGGHYRWLNNPLGQDKAAAGAVPRPGLAALDPANGVPLAWNPGRHPRGHGAEVVYATSAGIWVGSDTDFIGNYQYKHQKLDFFPFAGGAAATGDNTGDARTVFLAGASGNSLTANTFDPSTGAGSPVASQPSNGGGISWSSTQGAFVLNGRIWYGSGGQFYYRSWDGANAFGPAQLVDPYNDPYWSVVVNGSPPSGTTYRGVATNFYAEFSKVTGMFYANRSIYYTLAGSKNLYSRAFSPDTTASSVANQVTGGVISPVENTVVSGGNPVDFSGASGMFVAGGYLWYATKADGKLHKAPWNGTTVTGAGSIDTLATGNWAAPGVFVSPTAPVLPPTASFTPFCTDATCSFNASASTAPGSTITSYAWDFGDGTAGTGVTPSHTYGAVGTYQVKLTVTNAKGAQASVTNPATVTSVTAAAVAFVAAANTEGNATTETLTVPGNVVAGDAMVLIASGATGGPLSAPSGWTPLGTSSASTAITTTAWQKAAAAGDPGSPVTVTFPAVVHGTVQLLAYSGATTPAVASVASSTRAAGTTYATPASTVPGNGDLVISYWTAKSSAVTGWSTPAAQSVRSTANGSGTGRINSVATDAGAAPAGPAGGLSATTAGSAGAFAAWTIVLDGSGTGPPPPPPPPAADYSFICTLLACHFDASTSSAPGGTLTGYSWDFGDGTPAGIGATVDHTFAAANTYQVKLTVTDSNSNNNSKSQPVTVTSTVPPPPAVAFVGSAATNGNGTTETVSVPANVAEGDGLLLVATGATGGPLTAPAGWILVDTLSSGTAATTSLWQRVATDTDHGSSVTVGFPGVVHGTVQLVAYSGTSTADPVITAANRITAGSATSYATPAAAVPSSGDVVVSVWAVKSSTVGAWTAPAGQTVRTAENGSGGGRINSLVSDGGSASAGPAGGLTATTDKAGSVFAAWTVVIG